MGLLAWTRCWCGIILLAAVFILGSSHRAEGSGSKVNSIKSTLLGESPTPSTNHSASLKPAVVSKKSNNPGQVYLCSSDKECDIGSYCHSPQHAPSRCLACRRKKKRCHRDNMCCPGNHCSNYICIPITETVLAPHITAVEGHNKKTGQLSTKEKGWPKTGKAQSKLPHVKGHEGDRCLRSSDCVEGYCCARHFWTKICKPVLQLGEVCTRHRKKGTHGLEIFQRCECAKGLSCKIWKDATSSSKSRLHMCQKV
ncbi:dickkopf-related protein 2 [Lepisosteus oculatus]|uniref:Dickkopf WNT signaling pathway inhibitor 2 n=1 Tax=Lepisosteus oculatus TaxID=7918 RepID=W5N4N6_LEPOC|nr:PREDICTED: dickkopf-related protein 2 [Lepisosteus oculatus]